MKKLILKILFILFLTNTILNAQVILEGKILERIQTNTYTYLKIKTLENKQQWAAVVKGNYKIASKVKIKQSLKTTNFTSKSLNRHFDSIVFGYVVSPEILKGENAKPKKNVSYDKNKIIKTTIKELIKNKQNFDKVIVQVEGKIVKISKAIMKSNWVHIEDKESNKIIFRTVQENLKVGQEVVARGRAETNINYGYGYSYDIIVLDSIFKIK